MQVGIWVCCKLYNRFVAELWLGFHSSDPTLPPPAPFKKEGGSKFRLSPPEGGIWKIKKGGGSMVQGQVLLKERGDWHFSYLIFSRFIIFTFFTFRNYFTLCKIVLCIWRKTIFFCHHNFMKKDHYKLPKNEPENIP